MNLEADLTWTGARFERGVRIRIEHGMIVAVGPAAEAPDLRLRDRALLPGFVNAHSHAFQRGGDPDAGLDAGRFRTATLEAFLKMRAAGITCVGEFHHLRHATQHDADYAFDDIVLEEASEAGLRVVLLPAYGDAAAPRRFRSGPPDAYWKQLDRLLPLCEGETRHLGAAMHGVRRRIDLAAVYDEARRRGFVFHLQFEGRDPAAAMKLLLESVEVGESTTCVHGPHTDPAAMERYVRAGGNVCLCPGTEGDPEVAVDRLGEVEAVALGTDTNRRISPLEDMHVLERARRAGAVRLLQAGTVAGARALGLPAGRIAPRCWADFVSVDLTARCLEGWTDATLPERLVRDGAGAIAATCVAGQWAQG